MTNQLEKIREIKRKYENNWLAIKGIVSVGIGETSEGRLGIIISVKENTAKYEKQIEQNIEGVSIEIQETGEIKAL